MQLTSEQQLILQESTRRHNVLKIIAFAGTGKTTTLFHITRVNWKTRFLYVAFNKSVQQEAQSKFPQNVQCRTMHSLAYREQGHRFQKKLVPDIRASEVLKCLNVSSYETAQFTLETLKNFLASADPRIYTGHIPPLVRSYYKNLPPPDFVQLAQTLWVKMSNPMDTEVGMMHDGYLKLFQLMRPRLPYDCVLIDEAQDLTPCVSELLLSQPGPKIIVGDPHQQIYRFRGAQNAMDQVISDKTLFLTHSFRFGPQISQFASLLLMVFKQENKELIGLGAPGRIGRVAGKHTVLCRTNAMVFDTAVNALDAKSAFGFVGNPKSYKFQMILDGFHLFEGSRKKVRSPAIRHFKQFDQMKQFAEDVEDWELVSLCKIVEKYQDRIPYLVEQFLKHSLPAEKAQVLVTTAHKSKGLEFDQVRLSNDYYKLMDGSDLAALSEVDPDEINLIYVAVTRAKMCLELCKDLDAFQQFIKKRLPEESKALQGASGEIS